MEETLSSLKSIGAEEISRRTHISLSKVYDILEKRFEKFDRVKVAGFTKIIEREFKVDLSEWLEEFYKYSQENALDTEDEELELRTNFIEKKDRGSGLWKLLIVLIAIVVIGGFLAYTQDLIPFAKSYSVQGVAQSKTHFDEDAKDEISPEKKVEQDVQESLSQPNSEAIDHSLATTDVVLSDDTTQALIEEPRVVEDINGTSSDTQEPALAEKRSLEFKIVPRSKVWIGTIDLKTKQRDSLITEEDYSLDVDSKILLITGHGDLAIVVDGNRTEYSELNPLRFVIDSDGARAISYEEFKALNGGSGW